MPPRRRRIPRRSLPDAACADRRSRPGSYRVSRAAQGRAGAPCGPSVAAARRFGRSARPEQCRRSHGSGAAALRQSVCARRAGRRGADAHGMRLRKGRGLARAPGDLRRDVLPGPGSRERVAAACRGDRWASRDAGSGRQRIATGPIRSRQGSMRRAPPAGYAGADIGAHGRGPPGPGSRIQERRNARPAAFGGLAVGRLDVGRLWLDSPRPPIHAASGRRRPGARPLGDCRVARSRSVAAGRRTRVRPGPGRRGVVHAAGAVRAVVARLRRNRAPAVGLAGKKASGRTRGHGVAAWPIPVSW